MIMRILRLIGAYFLAAIVAALIIVLGFASLAWPDVARMLGSDMWRLFLPILTFVLMFTVVPAMIIIAIAEWWCIRSWLFYAGAGLVVPALSTARTAQGGDQALLLFNAIILTLAGFAAGLTYRLAAGCRDASAIVREPDGRRLAPP